jgi:hypothetical protein
MQRTRRLYIHGQKGSFGSNKEMARFRMNAPMPATLFHQKAKGAELYAVLTYDIPESPNANEVFKEALKK